jgi:hypothetical protein
MCSYWWEDQQSAISKEWVVLDTVFSCVLDGRRAAWRCGGLLRFPRNDGQRVDAVFPKIARSWTIIISPCFSFFLLF